MKENLIINVIQSRTFRRLKGKKQSFNHLLDDHCRDRMTHSLDVLSVAELITYLINREAEKNSKFGIPVDKTLVKAIALLHDIGHTPYGHAGERKLHNLCNSYIDYLSSKQPGSNQYEEFRGFKHNLQSGLILSSIDKKILEDLNLFEKTRVLSGVINHSTICYNTEADVGHYSNLINKYSKTFVEGNIVYLADEIAQLYADFEDAIDRNLITIEIYEKFLNDNNAKDFDRVRDLLKSAIGMKSGYIFGYLYDNIIKDLIENLIGKLDKSNKNKLSIYNPESSYKYKNLKSFLLDLIKSNKTVCNEDQEGEDKIEKLFNFYLQNPLTLKDVTLEIMLNKDKNEKLSKLKFDIAQNQLTIERKLKLLRLIVNHISGMTDHYADNKCDEISEKDGLLEF